MLLIMFETNMNIKDCIFVQLVFWIWFSEDFSFSYWKYYLPLTQATNTQHVIRKWVKTQITNTIIIKQNSSTCSLRDQWGAGGRMCCSKYQGHSSWLDAICVDSSVSLFDSAQSCHAMDRRNLESWWRKPRS